MGKRNSDSKRKLVLKKETLRQLQNLGDDDLQRVGGGTLVYGGGGGITLQPLPTLPQMTFRCVLMPSINAC